MPIKNYDNYYYTFGLNFDDAQCMSMLQETGVIRVMEFKLPLTVACHISKNQADITEEYYLSSDLDTDSTFSHVYGI